MPNTPHKSGLVVPFEPLMYAFLQAPVLSACMEMTFPNLVLADYLEVVSISCAFLTAFFCVVGYFILVRSKNDKLVEPSRSASQARREMGLVQFVFRLLPLFLGYGLLMGAGVWLAAGIFGKKIPSFWEVLLCVVLASIILAIGILLQSLALDSHYWHEEETAN